MTFPNQFVTKMSQNSSEEVPEPKTITSVDFVNSLASSEGTLESPIDINVTKTEKILLPPLVWNNFEVAPKKVTISNTVLLMGQWKKGLPHLTGGPLRESYNFSQLHIHWGANDMAGSEHTIDGSHLSGEIHLIFYKSTYSTHESALKENDGIVIVVYMLNLQEVNNIKFQVIVDFLMNVQPFNTNTRITPAPSLSRIVDQFNSDYFMYWGSINTTHCTHIALWIINRRPMSVSIDQIDMLRNLMNEQGGQIVSNYREVKLCGVRHLFHVNPSDSEYSTLLLKRD